ncbi:MAG: fasciclin domain-containing protein [Bacteroidota bacterium]
MKKQLLALALIGGLITAYGCSDTKKKNSTDETETTESEIQKEEVIEEQTPNIVGVAAGNENFSTLVAAVKAAELVETLSGEGPFTVFAPVNAAFEKLPEGTLDELLKPESKGTLTAILTYHVVAGNVKAADVVKAIQDNNGSFVITTVQGNTLTASLDGDNVILTDAKGGTSTIVLTDVAASNGVIHAIDTVVMP